MMLDHESVMLNQEWLSQLVKKRGRGYFKGWLRVKSIYDSRVNADKKVSCWKCFVLFICFIYSEDRT